MVEDNYDYLKILEEYALPKLDEYSNIIEDLLFRCGVYTAAGSPDEEENQRQRQTNKEMYSKLKAGSLEALVILDGDKEKLMACINLALDRNCTARSQGSYVVITSINVDSFCGEVKSLAYLLEQKGTEDYSNEPIRAFDKVMEKSGFEVRELEPDKLPPKRKK